MSVIKRHYEISVWRDVLSSTIPSSLPSYNYNSDNLDLPKENDYDSGLFLDEEEIAIIGSDTMTSQNAVCEPCLNLDTKGKTTLTFSIYRQYYDNKTGKLVKNPFYQYIQNEQKIKLFYDDGISEDKWRDFIITSVSPETENYKVSVIATDLAVMELSKIGFNKTFNSELQNNTNTINNLAKYALEGTAWSLDERDSDTILQFQEDTLVKLKVRNGVNATLYAYDSESIESSSITFSGYNNYVYCFYSQLINRENQKNSIDIIFLKNTGNNNNWTTREAEDKDFKDNILQGEYFGCISSSNNYIVNKNLYINTDVFTILQQDMELLFLKKGKRLIRNQLTSYDPILKRYVKQYTKNEHINGNELVIYYGYEDAEYKVQPLVQNLVTNGENQVSLDGWFTASNLNFHQSKLKLGTLESNVIKPSLDIANTGKNSFLQGNTIGNPSSRPRNTKFFNFIVNTGFRDNNNLINNLQENDKFRMQVNVTENHLDKMIGLHPYIVRLPAGKSSGDLMDDVSVLNSTITLFQDGNIQVENSPILINFSYISKWYRMYNYNAWYCDRTIDTNSGLYNKNTKLAPLSETGLVPIYINQDSIEPLFYCPYYRIYCFLYNRLVTDLINNSHPLVPTWNSWDGTYDMPRDGYNFYLTSDGKTQVLNYFSGQASYFRPLDFCILADLKYFIQDTPFGFRTQTPAGEKPDYFVMFDGADSNNIFIKPSDSNNYTTLSAWFDNNIKEERECYHVVDTYNNEYYYKIGKYKNDTFIEDTNISYNVFLNGEPIRENNNVLECKGIDFSDLVTLLRIRNTWKITHYEPISVDYIDQSYGILDGNITLETEGTYYGIVSATGGWSGNEGSSLNDIDTKFTNIVYVNNSNMLNKDELKKQENLIMFSNYAGYEKPGIETVLPLNDIILTRYYTDDEGKVVTPETIPSASTRTIYKYFDKNYGLKDKPTKAEDIIYLYEGYTKNNDYMPVINEKGEAYNSITLTESNVFNILQKLCEIFNCWVKISLKHDNSGKIILNNGKPEGKISFHKYIGENLQHGFIKGLNLESLQRTDVSEEIITKMIVKQNNNEFGKDKICTISRSVFNPLGINEIYNFDYYINKGILQSNIYDILQTHYGKPLNQIKTRILSLQEEIKQLVVIITQLQAEQDYYKTQYNSAIGEVTSCKNYFEMLTDISYADYINTPNSASSWSTDGFIPLFEDCREKIEYYTSIQDFAYKKWQEYEDLYNEYYKDYKDKNNLINILAKHREKIMQKFYNIYHEYIHEGSWISEDYLDDDKYYFAALDVLNTSAQPKVTYTFNVIDVGALEEFKGYNFKLGDKTYVEDPEFFGYEEDGVTPRKEEVTISGMQINLDSPDKNTITVQNYRTQFQDLFQRMAATVQAVEYHTGNYTNTKSETL